MGLGDSLSSAGVLNRQGFESGKGTGLFPFRHEHLARKVKKAIQYICLQLRSQQRRYTIYLLDDSISGMMAAITINDQVP